MITSINEYAYEYFWVNCPFLILVFPLWIFLSGLFIFNIHFFVEVFLSGLFVFNVRFSTDKWKHVTISSFNNHSFITFINYHINFTLKSILIFIYIIIFKYFIQYLINWNMEFKYNEITPILMYTARQDLRHRNQKEGIEIICKQPIYYIRLYVMLVL